MQLSDLMEKKSIKEINQKTNIAEENIQKLIEGDFEGLKRVQVLGFISILERTYALDLSEFRTEVLEYFVHDKQEDDSLFELTFLENKRKKSKLIPLLMLVAIIGYASWYFFTQYDRSYLNEYLHQDTRDHLKGLDNPSEKPSPVANSVKQVYSQEGHQVFKKEEIPQEPQKASAILRGDKEQWQDINRTSKEVTETITKSDTSKMNIELESQPGNTEVKVVQSDLLPKSEGGTQPIETPSHIAQEKQIDHVMIKPKERLWFGLVDMESQERKQYTVSESFDIDVRNRRWLVATSSAPFTMEAGAVNRSYNDAKEHYFKLDKGGVEVLTKQEYVNLGGYPQW